MPPYDEDVQKALGEEAWKLLIEKFEKFQQQANGIARLYLMTVQSGSNL